MADQHSKVPVQAVSSPIENPFHLLAVTACFVLSGFAALLYQTAWLRQFSLVFGTSELAVATVLAAYMGGLAIGAMLAERFLGLVRRPVLTYGILEAGIAVSALAVPWFLGLAGLLYAAVLGGQPGPVDAAAFGQSGFYLIVGFLVLLVPTGLMGATLPLLTRYAVRTDAQVGSRVALLYGSNTAGAVLGTLVAAFVLLPRLGLSATVWVGVVVNFLVFLLAALLARSQTQPVIDNAEPGIESTSQMELRSFWKSTLRPMALGLRGQVDQWRQAFDANAGWVPVFMFVSGANAFLYEVLWTRMLAHVLGGSIYAFATMLAAFLTGIAIGGTFAGRFAATRSRAALGFVWCQVGIALLSILVYLWMEPLLPASDSGGRLIFYAVATLLPATLFIGATFPLSVRVLSQNEAVAPAATARIYAWNTAGAIVGAVMAGFFIIPGMGFQGAIKLAVLVNLIVAISAALLIARRNAVLLASLALLLLAVSVLFQPSRPMAVISRTGFDLTQFRNPLERYFAVGRSSTVLLLEEGGYFQIRTNGLPEANIQSRGTPPFFQPETWLTALPVILRPETEDLLMIGLGGGVAIEGVPPSVEHVDVIELEPEVITANRLISANRNVDPLSDPRMRLVVNDARNALQLTRKRYGAIVSQPSHPWTAGASHLFTREFFASVKSHLESDGVFVQWINSEFLTEPLMKSLTATLRAEFGHVQLYQPARQMLVFVGSDHPLAESLLNISNGALLQRQGDHYTRLGILSFEDVLISLLLDDEQTERFSEGAALSTDDFNLMATQSRSRADGLKWDALQPLTEETDPLRNSSLMKDPRVGDAVNRPYLVSRLVMQGQSGRSENFVHSTNDAALTAFHFGLIESLRDSRRSSKELFRRAVELDPNNAQYRFMLLKSELYPVDDGQSTEREMEGGGLPESALAVLTGLGISSSEWHRLKGLEDVLGMSKSTDLWYPDALRLRAKWRVLENADADRLTESMGLINRALVLNRGAELFLLRALAAKSLQDVEMQMESFRYVLAGMQIQLQAHQSGSVQLSVEEIIQMIETIDELVSPLKTHDSLTAQYRAMEVIRGAEGIRSALVEAIDSLSDTSGKGAIESSFLRLLEQYPGSTFDSTIEAMVLD